MDEESTSPNMMDNVSCSGIEEGLGDCFFHTAFPGSVVTGNTAAAVLCTGKQNEYLKRSVDSL